ncbi:MAG: M20/M25/M40 family metallo-hydrolase [Planctomycetota bacterium]
MASQAIATPAPAEPADAAELLRAMVAFDTVTPHVSGRCEAERPLAEWIAGLAPRWGLAPQWLPVAGHAPNLLLTRRVRADAPWWLLDSHLDTVGVGGMTIDPFGGVVRDGRLYGRGACDTKGTGAAMLWAAKRAIAAGTLGANLAVLLSVGEEHAQVGARAFIEHGLPALDWRPAGVVVGEPTQMRCVAASNGFVRWRIVTRGRAAHSSTPGQGHNAIYDMARVVLAMERDHIGRLDAQHPMTGHAACSINGIEGGVQHNIVPDRCVVQVDQRLTPGQAPGDALASAHAAIKPLLGEPLMGGHTGLDYAFEGVESAEAFAPAGGYGFAESIAQRLEAAGVASAVTGAPYTTNANHYAQAGLPCVVLGPGDIAQAHTVDEWLSLEQLELGVRGYGALLESPPPQN